MRACCKSRPNDRIAKASAVARKRSKAQGVGGKPTNVATFAKKRKSMAFGGRV